MVADVLTPKFSVTHCLKGSSRPLTAAETFEARTWVDREQLHRDKKERALLILAYLAGLHRAGS